MRVLTLVIMLLIAVIQPMHAQNLDSLKTVWQDTNMPDLARIDRFVLRNQSEHKACKRYQILLQTLKING